MQDIGTKFANVCDMQVSFSPGDSTVSAAGRGAVSLVQFDEHMLQLTQPLLLAFLRLEVGHDQQLEMLEEVAKANAETLHVAVLDLSHDKRFRQVFNIMGTPTYIVLKKGQELDRMLGKADAGVLQTFLRQVLDFA